MREGDPHWLRLLTANDIENETSELVRQHF